LVASGITLVLLLLLAGIGLGGKLLGKSARQASTPPVVVSPAAPAVIGTVSVSIQGTPTTVLTTKQGLTLYYFKPDTATTTACTGPCIASWPPLLFQGTGTPTASSTLPGTLSVVTSANGSQVAYQSHQLYTFKGDTAPGQANGQGKAGKWFVATPTLALNSSTPALLQTASVTLGDTPTTILTTADGLTLYYFTPDTASTAACTGNCAATWHPLLFSGSGTPTASSVLPGTLSVQTVDNGPQVEYNGHLLYTFSGDTAPGQTNGQGKGGKWFVATPSLTPIS
jgi:predicted lipoprotein with Yx(FWY)xxD motif